MPLPVFAALLAFLCLLPCGQAARAGLIETEAADFAAAISTRDGLLVALGTSGESNDESIDSRGSLILVTLGTASYSRQAAPTRKARQPAPTLLFDLRAEASDFASQHPPPANFSRWLEDFAGHIQEKFEDAFRWEPVALWPEDRGQASQPLFQVVIIRFSAREKDLVTVRFHYERQQRPMVGWSRLNQPDEAFSLSRPLVLSSQRLADELQDPHNPDFASARCDSNFISYFDNPPPAAVTSAAAGQAVLEKLSRADLSARGTATQSRKLRFFLILPDGTLRRQG